jgi:hypothetical protein
MSESSRAATADDLKRLAQALDAAGARYLLNIRVADEITVDLLFSPCGETYETLKRFEQRLDLDGVPIRTVSLPGLLLTKQTQRPQDLQDSIVLRHAIAAGRSTP